MILKVFKLGLKRSKLTCLSRTQLLYLYEVLEETATSKQPIEEESMIKTSQDIMKDKHKALGVLQAMIARVSLANSFEEDGQLPPIDEEAPP